VLTGPQVLSGAEQVHMIGEAIGRPLRFETVPVQVAAVARDPRSARDLGDGAGERVGSGIGIMCPGRRYLDPGTARRAAAGRDSHAVREWVAGSLGEEGEAVAVRVEQEELPASGAVLAGFGRRGESVVEYGAIEVVDVVDLEVERRA
jgi:hypothetical protein